MAWITAGYPEGVPGPDRVPLLALLRRRLTDDEVKAVAALIDNAVRAEPEVRADGIDRVDIGVLITQITDELPSPDDVERVRERLAAKGWPLDDPRDAIRPNPTEPTKRTAHSHPAPARHPVRRRGTVGAGRRSRTCSPGAPPCCRFLPTTLRQTALLTTSLRAGEDIDDDVAVVVSTSGTTGTPKGAMLTASALMASAEATHRRLGGPGRWLLALPAHHVAGFQVLVRSVVAGTDSGGDTGHVRRQPISWTRSLRWAQGGGTPRWWRPSWTRRWGIRTPPRRWPSWTRS